MHEMIQTAEENKFALTFVERLMDIDPPRSSKEGNLLRLLSDAIQAYESKALAALDKGINTYEN